MMVLLCFLIDLIDHLTVPGFQSSGFCLCGEFPCSPHVHVDFLQVLQGSSCHITLSDHAELVLCVNQWCCIRAEFPFHSNIHRTGSGLYPG